MWRRSASRSDAPLELTGHSKGGNLSVYAAAFAGEQAQQLHSGRVQL